MLFPGDESGDCRRFTEQLAARAQQHGVKFLASTTVTRLVANGARITRIVTDRGDLTADAYVLACGSYSPLLLKPLGVRLPVYPVKGYSITVPITNDVAAPQGTLTDEAYKVVITRLGKRLRAAGTAELCGYDLTLRPSSLATLAHVVRDLFPATGDLTGAEPWAGLRPMTPDNPPVIGATPFSESVPQHRPRHPRLDHGLRFGKIAGRYGLGQNSRDRSFRFDARTLCATRRALEMHPVRSRRTG